jgi:hypothetical protein
LSGVAVVRAGARGKGGLKKGAVVLLAGGGGLGDSLTPPLAATSAGDAWIFPAKVTHVGLSYFAYNYALHWNGKAWHASAFPAKLVLQSAADLGAGDVWAFGVIMPSAGTTVPYAARFNRRAWHQVKLPVVPLAIGTTGHGGLWVIGPTTASAARAASQQHITSMYWNGKSWRSIAVPKVKVPAGQSSFDTASVATAGPRDLWWSFRADNGTTNATRSGLLHWTGTAWHAIAVPAAIAYVEAMTPDGHGGIWLAAGTGLDLAQYWYHYTSGRWTRTPVPSPKGYTIMLFGMALIPGTASVWADGEADANTGAHTVGVIEKYGA